MSEPKFANVINNTKFPIDLTTHDDSVQIQPTHTTVKILAKFALWGLIPNGLKIDSWVLNDGRVVKTLETNNEVALEDNTPAVEN